MATVARGGSAEATVYVGEDMPGMEVWLRVSGVPEWLDVSLNPEIGVTPYTSTLEVVASEDAPPGTHTIYVEAWSGEILLESVEFRVEVEAFQAPEMSFRYLVCPESVYIGEEFYVSGEFQYSAPQEVLTRLSVYLDGVLSAYVERALEGSGAIVFSAQLVAPEEPGTATLTALLQYYNPFEDVWETADTASCDVEVRVPPTSVEVWVYGLPENLTVRVELTLPTYEVFLSGEAGVDRPYEATVDITGATVASVRVEEEVLAEPGVKYRLEDSPVINFYISPGMRFVVSFNYSAWYLLKKEVSPRDDMLLKLSDEVWVKAGEAVNISAPQALQARNRMFILDSVEVDGESYPSWELVMDSPHTVRYSYREFLRLRVEVEPEAPELSASVGEKWIERGEYVEIPFQTLKVGGIRYVPMDASSALGTRVEVEDGVVRVSEVQPGDVVVLSFRKEVLVEVWAAYLPGEPFKVLSKWVEVGGRFEEDVSELFEPGVEGVRVELEGVEAVPRPESLEEPPPKLVIPEVSEPTVVEVKLRRFYKVRNLGVLGWPQIELECSCEGCEWSRVGDMLEAWAPEGVRLRCRFPAEWRLDRTVLRLERGFVGGAETFVEGELEEVVDKPVDAGAEVSPIKLYELKGYTALGKFIGAGIYPEGSRVSWRVVPREVPAGGVLGALGFVWRAVNPGGVVLMDSDKEVVVEWELVAKLPSTLLMGLEAAATAVLLLATAEYLNRWRRGVRRAGRRPEPGEGGER